MVIINLQIHSLTIQSPSPIRNGDREVSLRHVEKMKNYRNNPFYIEIIVSIMVIINLHSRAITFV
jgi:hypothetical protein